MDRRRFLRAGAAAGLVPTLARAQTLERHRITLAVGGRHLFYHLPLTIASQLGYFEAEGLEVNVVDFSGGAQVIQAVAGGSADVGSGAFEHAITMQARGHGLRAFVVEGRAPQTVLAASTRTLRGYRTLADLKGRRIGVTALGASTNLVLNYLLTKAGIKPAEVTVVGVGASTGAVAAVRNGQIDAIATLDPVITLLERSQDVRVIVDLRRLDESRRILGGLMPAGCLYAPIGFVERYPNTVQALANAIVRANRWIQSAGPSDILRTVPESYLFGDRAIYIGAFLKVRPAFSPDGLMAEEGPATALRVLRSFDEGLRKAKIDLSALYTNEFAHQANLKYPNG